MRPALFLVFTIIACSPLPERDYRATRTSPNAPYPELLPTEMLSTSQHTITSTTANLQSRATALRNRADMLRRRTIIDQSTRSHLNEAVNHTE